MVVWNMKILNIVVYYENNIECILKEVFIVSKTFLNILKSFCEMFLFFSFSPYKWITLYTILLLKRFGNALPFC